MMRNTFCNSRGNNKYNSSYMIITLQTNGVSGVKPINVKMSETRRSVTWFQTSRKKKHADPHKTLMRRLLSILPSNRNQ